MRCTLLHCAVLLRAVLLCAVLLCAVLLGALAACASTGNEAPAPASTPAADGAALPPAAPLHPVLDRFVGEWVITGTIPDPAGGAPSVMTSRETAAALGPWIVSTMQTSGPMGAFEARLSLTHDAASDTFRGTWIDTSSSWLWTYTGTLDAEGTTLTLEAEGPSFDDPNRMALYRDSTEFVDLDHRILRSSVQGQDGEWFEFMRADAKRVR